MNIEDELVEIELFSLLGKHVRVECWDDCFEGELQLRVSSAGQFYVVGSLIIFKRHVLKITGKVILYGR